MLAEPALALVVSNFAAGGAGNDCPQAGWAGEQVRDAGSVVVKRVFFFETLQIGCEVLIRTGRTPPAVAVEHAHLGEKKAEQQSAKGDGDLLRLDEGIVQANRQ